MNAANLERLHARQRAFVDLTEVLAHTGMTTSEAVNTANAIESLIVLYLADKERRDDPVLTATENMVKHAQNSRVSS